MRQSSPFRSNTLAIGFAVALSLVGCGQTNFDTDISNLDRVAEVRDNANLTGDEKRQELRDLGFDEVDINGLLRADRTANQFGGTAETGLNKVADGLLNTMTPDEIQLYGDLVGEATFSDAQAQELLDLFVLNAIATRDELKTFLEDNDIDSPAGLEVGEIQATFVDADPEDFIANLP